MLLHDGSEHLVEVSLGKLDIQGLSKHLRELEAVLDKPEGGQVATRLGTQMREGWLPANVAQAIAARVSRERTSPVAVGLTCEIDSWSSVPWELLRLPEADALSLDPRIRFYREVGGIFREPRSGTSRSSVLIVTADPQSAAYPELKGLSAELQSIQSAFRSPECHGMEPIVQRYATPSAIGRALTESSPRIMHYLGHVDEKASGPVLILHGERDGQTSTLSATELVQMAGRAGVELVILSGCKSAGPCGSLARGLIEAGISHVVAMQFRWGDSAAGHFARAFYATLAEGESVMEAVYQGRTALTGIGAAWAAPVLYSRSSACEPFILTRSSITSASAPQNNLTYEERPFIGRKDERTDLRHRIHDKTQRLVTVTGLGGMGKSRLCKQVAAELQGDFPDGVWLVECENLERREDIVAAISGVLKIRLDEADPESALKDHLKSKSLLLVLDCFERVVKHAPLVDELLRSCPRLFVLISSRIVLGLPREFEYALRPMGSEVKATATDSLNLFSEAATHVVRDFKLTGKNRTIAKQICAALEGVPLAIVLAAGRLRHVTLTELLEQIENRRLSVLKRRPVGGDKHADLQAVIAGSFALLEEREQKLLQGLSVFSGGFFVEDAQHVCDPDGQWDVLESLFTLRDHSLVHVSQVGSKTRYKILDTVREYLGTCILSEHTVEQLSRSKSRHAKHFARRASEVSQLMASGHWSEGTAAMHLELGNFRSAVGYARQQQAHSEVLEINDALARVLFEAGLWADFSALAEAAEESARETGRLEVIGSLLGLRGALESRRKDEEACRQLWLRRIEHCAAIGDLNGESDAYADLAWQQFTMGNMVEAKSLLKKSLDLALRSGNQQLVADIRVIRARLAIAEKDFASAVLIAKEAEEGLAQTTELHPLLFGISNLGRLYLDLGDARKSIQLYRRVLRIALESSHSFHVGWLLLDLAKSYEAEGLFAQTAKCLIAASKIHTHLASQLKSKAQDAVKQFYARCPAPGISVADVEMRSWHSLAADLLEGELIG